MVLFTSSVISVRVRKEIKGILEGSGVNIIEEVWL